MRNNEPIPYTSSLEVVEPDEDATIDLLNQSFDRILETTASDYGHAVRAVHAKAHGIIEGRMVVSGDLPSELAQGLFAHGGEYKVAMRLSTNAGDLLPDTISLPRGLAIKIYDVDGVRLPGAEGTNQDFIMVNGPVFQAKSVKQFSNSVSLLAKTTDRMEGTKETLSTILGGLNTALKAVGIESSMVQSLGGAPNVDPLGETYFSVTPFRYGDYVAKFSIVPISADLTKRTNQRIDASDRPDAIRETVSVEMQSTHAAWDFRVQLCRDLDRQPIEDPTVLWNETEAPFYTVATIFADPQDAWERSHVKSIDEETRFSVWTGLAAHQPLGGINRARRMTYEKSASFRAQFNRCPMHP